MLPEGPVQCLATLLVGLLARGWCPAMRQIVAHVDYATFFLFFALSTGVVGVFSSFLLSRTNDPDEGYHDLFDALRKASELERWSTAVFLACCSGACMGFSSFLFAAAMPMAGATRSFPVFNGVALVAGVCLCYAADGNGDPATLFGAVSMLLLAIAITFASRPAPAKAAGSLGVTQFTTTGILSYAHLRNLLSSGTGVPVAVPIEADPVRHGWESVHVVVAPSDEALPPVPRAQPALTGKPGALVAKPEVELLPPEDLSACIDGLPGSDLLKGLFFCGLAGVVDGCWPVLALGASLLGLENYIVLFFVCFGLVGAVALCETVVCATDPYRFATALRRLTKDEFLVTAAAGALNMASIVSFFTSTEGLSMSTAVALLSCTPLVSVIIGVRCLCGLVDEPLSLKLLVGAILLLYFGAVCVLSWNALTNDAHP